MVKRRQGPSLVAMLVGLCAAWLPLCGQPPAALNTARLLSEAREPVRIACLGDSITGAYYHSGNRRAWPEMLQVALARLYPKADVEVFNAGVSGNTSAQGLARLQRDVLARKPHLVIVMFGMNDLAYGAATPEQDAARKAGFAGNLKAMVEACRAAGAEVLLCTQNPVYTDARPSRPPERLGEFAGLIRQTGAALQVPVADIYAEWEALRKTDARSWRLLMSETIHPSMAGHKRMAERVAATLAGRPVSLADVLAEQPVCGGLIARLKEGKPVVLDVPAPLAAGARAMVLRRFPSAGVTIVSPPEKAASLKARADGYQGVRNRKPDLVFVTLAPDELDVGDEESYVRQVSWLVNWALPFSGTAWTAVGVDPALLNEGLTRKQREGAELLREIVRGHDLDWIGPPSGASVKLQDALDRWFDAQLGKDRSFDRRSGTSQND